MRFENTPAPNTKKQNQAMNSKGKRSVKRHTFGDNIAQMRQSQYDPNGSYTGVPRDPWEVPVQDADDL